jgi:hypothetical protein
MGHNVGHPMNYKQYHLPNTMGFAICQVHKARSIILKYFFTIVMKKNKKILNNFLNLRIKKTIVALHGHGI